MTAPSESSSAKSLPKKLGLTLAALFASLLIVEVGFRVLALGSADAAPSVFSAESRAKRQNFVERTRRGRPTLFTRGHVFDARLGWRPKPGLDKALGIGTTRVSTNSAGMRGRREYDRERTAGVLRIVTAGDSFTFGNDVRDDETWSARLEQALGACEVLNLGVSGYGLDQAALMIEGDGLRYAPDVIVWGIFQGDLERSMYDFTFAAKPRFRLGLGGLTLGSVPVPSPEDLLAAAPPEEPRAPLSYALDFFERRLASTPEAERLALNRAIVERVARACDLAGVRLVLVAIGSDRPQPFRANHLAVLSWRDELGCEVLDVEELWKQLDSFPFLSTGHMTPAANLALAERLAGELKSEAAPTERSAR